MSNVARSHKVINYFEAVNGVDILARFPYNPNINYAYSSLFDKRIAETMELL